MCFINRSLKSHFCKLDVKNILPSLHAKVYMQWFSRPLLELVVVAKGYLGTFIYENTVKGLRFHACHFIFAVSIELFGRATCLPQLICDHTHAMVTVRARPEVSWSVL